MRIGFSFPHFSSLLVVVVVLVALFPLCTSSSNDVLCKDDERQTLLEFKHGLIDETDRLASWVGEKTDCCTWTGIVCDNSTGHVQKIHLSNHCYTDDYSTSKEYEECFNQRLRGNLSPSLLHLKHLKHLDSSSNNFGGIQIPSFMGSFKNMRYLNLSRSGFGGSIPPQLGNLSELRILSLGSFYNAIFERELTSMSNHMHWLSSLHGLHHLDMSGVDLGKVTDLGSDIYPDVASLNLTSLAHLDLSDNYFINSSLPQWIFSITTLVSLDLSWCGFHHFYNPSSIDLFSNLTSVESLHVPYNPFMNSWLVLKGLSSNVGRNLISLDISFCGVSSSLLDDALHNLTSLLSLDLSKNELTKTIPKSLANLCNLRHINLEGNHFSNISLTSVLESFFECKLPRLESLSVGSSGLSGQLPYEIGRLTYLVDLQLGGNGFVGMIPDSIGRLSSLRSLNLQNNLISGLIPNSIGRLSSLEMLDLSDNQLNGSLPNGLGQLSELLLLAFSNNSLTGGVTKSHFAKLARLKILVGAGNNLTLRSHLANWIPSFQLKILSLSSWDLGPQFPSWLQVHTHLVGLEISNTRISSTIPDSFLRSLPDLFYLDMSQNHIQGIFPARMIPASIQVLDVSSNEFGGLLPQLSNASSALILDLSNNSFSGSLHHLLCPNSEKVLAVLNLANNHLSGIIPDYWHKWPSLSFLNLENNYLSGRIPTSLGSLSSLGSLNMCNNKLSGRLHMKNLTNLQILQLAGNELAGTIPAWFGRELPNLRILDLRSNNFYGDTTHQLCNLTSIQILDLGDNNLSGNIPRCLKNFGFLTGKEANSKDQFNFSPFEGMDALGSASLVIKGREDTYSTILGLVMVLDLSSNNFSGQIPSELMDLKAIRSLNLSRNQLTGRIPDKIGDLKLLESFDVSLNSLSGELPLSLSTLSFLSNFNVSFNNLTGRVPSSTQLQGFSESSFLGNKLCGHPLTKTCAVELLTRDQEEDKNGSHGADWGLIICIVSGLIVGFWAVLTPLILSTTWRIAYFGFLNKLSFSLKNSNLYLLNKLGSSFLTVYP
ncbi:unnamed protein product [Lactuca virosa]|uniref:Leucine-rich repeat-containing N-terminal plant-type domain-containing protein n=1 Tax=Lactuca virosa TaxID=75947 RepID=A0AAU9NMH2_9ASTR|nr:unnamed protein product [Lactuca virosa]